MKSKLTIVTGNPIKFRELTLSLSEFFDCEQGEIGGFEIQGEPEEILRYKLEEAFAKFNQPVLVDDTSIEIAELGGFPGPYIKDFSKALTIPGIGKQFNNSPVNVISLIGIIFSPGQFCFARGVMPGTIVEARAGRPLGSLDFDPIIVPSGLTKSFAEMTVAEKNAVSHRGKAIEDLVSKLKNK